MHQVAQPIWNRVAKTEAGKQLPRPWSQLLKADAEKVDQMIEELVYKPMDDEGTENKVQLAFKVVAPLLVANVAISDLISQEGEPSLRQALPEVTSVNEAVILATTEYQLSPRQQKQLTRLLRETAQQA